MSGLVVILRVYDHIYASFHSFVYGESLISGTRAEAYEENT